MRTKQKYNLYRVSVIISMFTLVLAYLISCKPEPIVPVEEYNEGNGVFICNEGNFTYGNASLSFYNSDSSEVKNQIFYNANSFPLGDVVQSMSIYDNKAFIVVNNSGKIMVINSDDFSHIATITGLTSPRYIEFINPTKAYVSDLYSPYITIVNPSTHDISGEIFVGNGTEQMVNIGGFVYVTGWSYNNKVYKINSQTDQLVDSIEVAKQPNSIVADNEKRIWVLSDGGYQGTPLGQDTAALTCINTELFTIEKEFRFSSLETSPTELHINKYGNMLFYINGSWGGSVGNQSGIYRMYTGAETLPTDALIPEGNQLFYGLGVDPENSDIYVSDAIDYIQKGIVFRYNSEGVRLDSFKVDIIPSAFCFK